MTACKAWFVTIAGTLVLLGAMGAVELAARAVSPLVNALTGG